MPAGGGRIPANRVSSYRAASASRERRPSEMAGLERVNSSRAPGDDPTLIERIGVGAGHLSEPLLAL